MEKKKDNLDSLSNIHRWYRSFRIIFIQLCIAKITDMNFLLRKFNNVKVIQRKTLKFQSFNNGFVRRAMLVLSVRTYEKFFCFKMSN